MGLRHTLNSERGQSALTRSWGVDGGTRRATGWTGGTAGVGGKRRGMQGLIVYAGYCGEGFVEVAEGLMLQD